MCLRFDITFILFIAYCCSLNAQSYNQQEDFLKVNNVWAFGQNAGIDFNQNPPVAVQTMMNTAEAAAVACNTSGALQFYTDGTTVWDKNHDTMQNGYNLTGISTSIVWGPTASSYQGAAIVRNPQNPDLYYVFSLSSREMRENAGRLYYSVIDMRLNNGKGAVLPNEKGIFLDSSFTEAMISVAGCNSSWLLVSSKEGILKAFNVTSSGVNHIPVETSIPESVHSRGSDWIESTINVAPGKRDKLVIVRGDRLVLYHFNPFNGTASNPIDLSESGFSYHDACFSPNNTMLYNVSIVGGQFVLCQYNLVPYDSASIIQGRITLSANEVFFARLGLAPDNKIYITRAGTRQNIDTILSVIHQPDKAGTACQFELNAFPLLPGTHSENGFPSPTTIGLLSMGQTTRKDTIVCFATQANLSAPIDAAYYEWSTGAADREITIDSPGIYWVRYVDTDCAMHTDTFHVRFFNPAIQTFSGCKNAANGKSIIIIENKDSFAYTLNWNDSRGNVLSQRDSLLNVPGGTYSVRITTPYGCDTTITFPIPEEEYHVAFTSDTLVCTHDLISFTNVSHPHFYEFAWDFGDGNGSTQKVPDHSYREGGTYRVRLSGKGALCSDTAYKTIIADARMDDLSFTISNRDICKGSSVTLSSYVTDSTMLNMHWNFGDGSSSAATEENIRHSYAIPGEMYITLTADFRVCPVLVFTDSITVHSFPKVGLGVDSVICMNNQPVTLRNNHPYESEHTYQWSNGSFEWEISVLHPGTYSLTVTNAQGCVATESIEVRKSCYIDIPNAFSPNGDGINDYFFPRQMNTKGIKKFHMRVWDRWGMNVFETFQSTGNGWDGRLKGVNQPQGVYLYLIELAGDNGWKEEYRGNVTLIR